MNHTPRPFPASRTVHPASDIGLARIDHRPAAGKPIPALPRAGRERCGAPPPAFGRIDA
ncbi:hypothetical protein [Thauera linaloolentis]|uniref:hypothetical protein n=1 Tax=Thauera linaloolentis TaxID=76112 RepID=UPI0002E56B2C|nr:hypothetical protein [Thauera linaloolentis]MCM8566733.1 hypothetical protein [Thauera linaloolentis]